MTSDSEGFSSETWTTVRTIWAHLAPLQGTELFQAGQNQEDISHVVTIRYAGDLNPQMRLLYGNRIFFVHNVLDMDDAHEWVTLLCKETIIGANFIAKIAGVIFQKPALSGSGHSP